MKHCPNRDCQHLERYGRPSEFVDSVSVCFDCGGSLASGEPPADPGPAYQDLTTVYETSDRIRAHLVRSVLEDAEIPAHVHGDALQGALGELPLTMLSIRLHVPSHLEEEARRVIAESVGG